MPKVINTLTGSNYFRRYNTPADKSFINDVQLYEKQVGSDGASNTVFTINGSYIPGSSTLWVFVNGQKVEKVVSASSATEYEETSINSITFGSALADSDVVEFYVAGTYQVDETDLTNLVENGAIPTSSFKNKIINGNFDIWQRNTTQTSSAYGSDDRWKNENIGSTKTHSQQSFTVGQTDVPNNPKYYSRTVVTSSAGAPNYVVKYQKVESVYTFASKTATFSFWAKADSGKNIAIEFNQAFGTGGSPSSPVLGIGVVTCSLTTSWQKFEINVVFPSISGKTIGTNGDDSIVVIFWFDAGSDFNSRTNSLGQQSGTFDIAQVQLEEGSIATPFEKRHIQTELALCQRYYCKTYSNGVFPGAITNIGRCIHGTSNAYTAQATIYTTWFYPVNMRTIPSVSVYSPLTGTSGKVVLGSGDTDPSVVAPGFKSSEIDVNETSSTGTHYVYYHATADAEL